jgi:hypothetical protein
MALGRAVGESEGKRVRLTTMSDPSSVLFLSITEGGTGAAHAPNPPVSVLVGPATSAESNLIRSAIIPIACWRLGDIRFGFDSSFVVPEAQAEFQVLSRLIDDHTEKSPPKSTGEKLRPPLSRSLVMLIRLVMTNTIRL